MAKPRRHLFYGRRARLTVLALTLALCLPAVASALPTTGLWISEVMYDPSGTDDGNEWIELFNSTATDIVLDGYSLGWGANSYTDGTVQLSGTIAADAYFVVGESNISSDLTVDFFPELENPNWWQLSAAVALFDVTEAALLASLPANPDPIHAVTYGGWLSTLPDEQGNVNWTPMVGDAPAGQSIEFQGPATGWATQAAPVAGDGPLDVAEAHTAWLILSAVAFALIRGRVRG